MGASISRNGLCPCGSGRKYKRCCLRERQAAVQSARRDDATGQRIQAWSAVALQDELTAALEEFTGGTRTMDEDDLPVFSTWFHNDRRLPSGATPAERYAARTELSSQERDIAVRIAGAQLGVHRVLDVKPGQRIELENVLTGTRTRVQSANVSRDAVRWDIVIGRVMGGDPPSLWGPTRLLAAGDETELRSALDRLGGARAIVDHPLEVMRWQPARWSDEPSFFTLEGDPVAQGSATWLVHDPAAAAARLRALGGLLPGDPVEVDITMDRATLVSQRPDLPRGALVLEAGPLGELDVVSVATIRLEAAELRVATISEQRLDRVIEIVEDDLGDLVTLASREIAPFEPSASDHRPPRDDPPAGSNRHQERRLVTEVMTERMCRWADEPNPKLGGRTPREATSEGRHAEVLDLVRSIENQAERARRRGEPYADIAAVRRELGIVDEILA